MTPLGKTHHVVAHVLDFPALVRAAATHTRRLSERMLQTMFALSRGIVTHSCQYNDEEVLVPVEERRSSCIAHNPHDREKLA